MKTPLTSRNNAHVEFRSRRHIEATMEVDHDEQGVREVASGSGTIVCIGGYHIDLSSFVGASNGNNGAVDAAARFHSSLQMGSGRLVQTQTTLDVIRKLVQAILLEVPIIVQGDIGCGKSFLIREMAKLFGQDDTMIELSLDDQSDSKTLYGKDFMGLIITLGHEILPVVQVPTYVLTFLANSCGSQVCSRLRRPKVIGC
jgi:hypothetical protein